MKCFIASAMLSAAVLAAWLTAVVVDGTQRELGWLVAEVLVAPVGVVRGVLIWLGVAG